MSVAKKKTRQWRAERVKTSRLAPFSTKVAPASVKVGYRTCLSGLKLTVAGQCWTCNSCFTRLPPFCALHPGNKRTFPGTGYSIVCQYNRGRPAMSMKQGIGRGFVKGGIPPFGRNDNFEYDRGRPTCQQQEKTYERHHFARTHGRHCHGNP
jgi:hypothetical protein